jgi:hypothetical protein
MGKDEWLTPPEILEKLGMFDLDPCAPVNAPWNIARHEYNICDDGLSLPWGEEGNHKWRVWLNPPYGRETGKWLKRMSEHDKGLALIFARTETKMFFDYVWEKASAILFIKNRIHFHHVDGSKAKMNGGAPSCLIAYGEEDKNFLANCGIEGQLVVIQKKLRIRNCS